SCADQARGGGLRARLRSLARREGEQAMTVVGDQCADRGADDDRGLRQLREHRQDKPGEHRVARALPDRGDGGVAYRLVTLRAPAAVEGESAIEPPGQHGRGNEREEPGDERVDAAEDENTE